MDLQSLNDKEVLYLLHKTVFEERKITAQVIELLREVNDRKLYLKLGYGNPLDFCVKELKYSESSAYRRISAMRLSNDLPEISEKIIEGTLSLSVISQAQTFIRHEEKLSGERLEIKAKEELLKSLECKSSRETEKILIERSPEQQRPEKLRSITLEKSELKLTLENSTLEKLEKIKSLISHKSPNVTYSELIEMMAKLTLEKLDPLTKSDRKRITAPTRLSVAPSRYISAQTRKEVWKKAQGQCCYQDHVTYKRCSSRFQLQIDHIVPSSKNGPNNLANLQLLCRKHNQLKGFAHGH